MQQNEGKRQSDERLDRLLQQAAFLLFNGYEACFSPFLRSGMGSRYLLKGFVGGSVVIWLWVRYYPAEELIPFGCVWMAALLFQKIRSQVAERRGVEIHREYGGDPAMVEALPVIGRCNVFFAWCVVEPGLVFAASYGMELVSPALGRFFAWGSFVMLAHANMGRAFLKERVAVMRDARLHGQNLASYQENRR